MKVSLSLIAATATAKGGMKEWEVQNPYFAEKENLLMSSFFNLQKNYMADGRGIRIKDL